MQLILAIDSDPRRSEQLANLVHARLQVDLVQATSAGEGLHALRERVPDLILTSPLLSPFDDGVLDEYLRDLGSAATHVQTVRIPMLSSAPKKKSAATRLFSLGRKKTQTSPASPDGCDPKVFADEIAHYLTRSLEERSAFAKATADKSDSAKATADRSSSAKATADRSDSAKATAARSEATATAGQTAPSRVPALEPEPFDQIVQAAFAHGASAPKEWTAPDTLVQEFDEPHVAWPAETRAQAAPEPVIEESSVPGSIFDLRPASPKPRGEGGTTSTGAPRRVVAAEPESYAFTAPDPVVEPEPLLHELVAHERVVEVEPFESGAVDVVLDEPLEIAQDEPGQDEPVFITPQTFDSQIRPVTRVEPAPPVTARPVVTPPVTAAQGAARPFTAQPRSPVTQAPATGNSASFEAALAAIRAAWATPAPSPSTPPAVEPKAARRPGNSEDRSGGDDGRSDWGIVDPDQYELSTLVTRLDEGTDSGEVGARAHTTRDRATNRR